VASTALEQRYFAKKVQADAIAILAKQSRMETDSFCWCTNTLVQQECAGAVNQAPRHRCEAFVHQQKLSVSILPLFASMAIASACTFLAKYLCSNAVLATGLGIGSYLVLIFLVNCFAPKIFTGLN